jgi:heme-degrading monooxygenase HmoA
MLKHITVRVLPGRREDYLRAQDVWNAETSPAPGYLGTFCGAPRDDADSLHVFVLWRRREDYEAWMASDHDRIAALAGTDRYASTVEVQLLDDLLGAVGGVRLRVTGPGVDRTVTWTEMPHLQDVAADSTGEGDEAAPVASLLHGLAIDDSISHATVVSRDGAYRASIPLQELRASGRLAFARGGRPLPADAGGPLRLTVTEGSTLCWNVKDVSRIELTAGKQPDSVPENPPH